MPTIDESQMGRCGWQRETDRGDVGPPTRAAGSEEPSMGSSPPAPTGGRSGEWEGVESELHASESQADIKAPRRPSAKTGEGH